ncbi:MAG: helicase-related protein, partial [Planctomycetota bacterium]
RRLVQGDVGSGKTLIGVYAAAAVAAEGHQVAFMAPTELLAEQHHAGQNGLLERLGLRSALLSGSRPPAERRAVLAGLSAGEIDICFGTHALFSEGVEFASLALSVIDEQHRFGVGQRQRLLAKGRDVHALLMTATPIPRTLALTLYGDVDVSTLREKPPGRAGIRTRALPSKQIPRLMGFLAERLEAGQRAYWVCPRIDDSEEGRGVESAHAWLMRSKLAGHGIELVHGRLPSEERAARVERFRSGASRVLVGTTVIEVGVDVPQATVIVIEGVERLGLAQLHQLRGRVGRGREESFCFLHGKRSAAERVGLLERCDDGFELSEHDLAARGMGDLTGMRQAGANGEGLDDEALEVGWVVRARDLIARDAILRQHYLARAGRIQRD